jgi:hypothetical protein
VISDEPVDVVLSKPEVHLPAPNAMTREQRLKVITVRPMLEKWMEAVEDQEVSELLAGAAPLTHKLVEGKSNRKWKDGVGADDFFGAFSKDEVAPRTLISPAQMEKLIKASKAELNLSEFIEKPPGKPSLVPVEDKRPALVFNGGVEGLENMEIIDDVI